MSNWIYFITFKTDFLAYGSTPAEGSSNKINEGNPNNAIPSCSFLLFPPDNYSDVLCLWSPRPNLSIILSFYWSKVVESSYFKTPKKLKCSKTVIPGNNALDWGQ